MSGKVKAIATEDGAIIIVDGYEIRVTVKPTQGEGHTIDVVKSRLSEHLSDLNITEEPEGIVVRPVAYLGRDKFASIANIVREFGGNYISAGKESRFLIPKQ